MFEALNNGKNYRFFQQKDRMIKKFIYKVEKKDLKMC